MASIRVTQSILVQRTLSNLSLQLRSLMGWQERLATGLKVNAPSDNPLDARRAINIRSTIARNEQYLNNITAINPFLEETSTAIETSMEIIDRARELTLEGASGTFTSSQRQQIAVEVNQLLEEILVQANHETNDRFIFAGTKTGSEAFVATRNASGEITAITYQGNGESIDILVGDGVSITSNIPGDEVFQGTVDTFQMLIDIRDDLRAGNLTDLEGTRLEELSLAKDQMLQSIAKIGARQNRLERLTTDTDDAVLQLQESLSDTIDADYADTVLHLTAQTNAYQAALQAGARVIQPSLMDFLG